MTQAYIEGFQNDNTGLNKDSVITVVKHFAGGGPQLKGLDPHNDYGKEQVYAEDDVEYHLVPFEGAFAAKVVSVVPYRSIFGIKMRSLSPLGSVLTNFGSSDATLFDIISGKAKPEGKLPFELPSNWDAVLQQKEYVPHDSVNTLYPIHTGMSL